MYKKKSQKNNSTCKLCNIAFESVSLLQTHFEEDIAYCKDCNKCQFVNTDNIPEEECLKHNYVVDLHRCPKCIFTGKNETGLKIHMNAKHKEATNSNSS